VSYNRTLTYYSEVRKNITFEILNLKKKKTHFYCNACGCELNIIIDMEKEQPL